jgi:two-component system phosphate regulon sensor histidine kinase PhoR
MTSKRALAFVAGIAHDLKTPLATIATTAELLEQEIDRTTFTHLIKVIQRQAQRLNLMVGELSDRLRPSPTSFDFDLETFDLTDLVRTTTEDFRCACTTREICLEAPASPMIMWGDLGKARRILENLLRNALTYSPEDTRVIVRLLEVDDAGSRVAMLQVEDEGPGIPESMRERIFDAFVRLNDRPNVGHAGQGLGLHIVKTFAQAHKGTAYVEPAPSGGSRFCVRLPLSGLRVLSPRATYETKTSHGD